jgi:ABC-type multidrug transport system fused ATPase/permease subunit
LSLKFKRGSRVALIGASGSGKSTLLAVLRGLYDPQPDVQLRIDGNASPDWHAVGNHVTLFPQEPEIFENTIEYNITLGLPIPDAEVAEACRVARFDEVIHQLPKGLQAHIAEKGVNLSGGQKQRLALARGILAARESDLLLFDEPTSSVDPQTERAIYEQLFRQFSDKAVVSALHRLHLLPLFDYIYVMDNGRVVAEGSYADLKERHPEKLVT